MAKAAVTRSIRDDHQKNFLKIFEGLTGKHNRWEIWRVSSPCLTRLAERAQHCWPF